MNSNTGFTYVLKCNDNSYYVGSTKNISKRLSNHQNCQVKFTKSRLPIKLIFVKKFNTYQEAKKFEYKVKSWKKRQSIENMVNKPDNIALQFN